MNFVKQTKKENKNINVYVGLSGGVDSSVSAYLLKEAGYKVTGVFIKGWQPDWIPCTWKSDRISAMRTAAYLDIPFKTLDLEMEYKDKVVNYILEEYKNGNTPNPDMLCNREIKFGSFLKWAMRDGADFIATGHYAQITDTVMCDSVDTEKDQTYFLSQLTPNELKNVFFPIGHLPKSEVRKIASEQKLPVATRKDSQGICFVGDLEMKDFLKKELQPVPGNVLNEKGEVIGTHDGAILYTIGERHGFHISNKSENEKNHYVMSKNISKNEIVVGDKFESLENEKSEFAIKDLSFSVENFFDFMSEGNLSVRIRYRGEKISCDILDLDIENKTCKIKLSKNTTFASGQFAVIYQSEKVLGGGVIV